MITFNNVTRHLSKSPSVASLPRELPTRPALVKNLSFTINRGERVALVGANGAGKSTTVKLLTGLMSPSSGYIQVDGFTPAERNTAFLKNLGLVSANKNGLLDDLPIWESVVTTARFYGLSTPQIKTRFEELAQFLKVPDVTSRPVRLLSLGERARAELILALLHKPALLVLDEPTLGLDFQGSKLLRQHLRLLGERDQVTVLLTSHNAKDLLEVTTRLLVLVDGLLVYDGNYPDSMASDHALPYLNELRDDLIDHGGRNAA